MNDKVILNAARLQELLRQRRLKSLDVKVLMGFLAHLDDTGEVRVSQADIARDFGMAPQSVWRARKALLDCGVLRVRRQIGSVKQYEVDADFAYFSPRFR